MEKDKLRYNIEAALAICEVKPDKLLVDLLERICTKAKADRVIIATKVKGKRWSRKRIAADLIDNALLAHLGNVRYSTFTQLRKTVPGGADAIEKRLDALVTGNQVVEFRGNAAGLPNYTYYARRDSPVVDKLK